MKLRILSGSDISKTISMSEAIDVNAQAYAALSRGDSIMPQRVQIVTENGTALFMPAFLKPTGSLAVKVVSVYPENSNLNLPTVHALVLVLDSETGKPLALMDGTRLTALRTGAGVGAATQILAREEASVLALFGAGGLAMDQVQAIKAVRPIAEIRIYTPTGKKSDTFIEQINNEYTGINVWAADSPGRAVTGADIITCATTSHSPVFDANDVAPGTHINGVGSFTPNMREVPVTGYSSQVRLFVDCIEAVLAEAGEIMDAIQEGQIGKEDLLEIGCVIAGDLSGRTSEEEITFFKSVGVAVQDAATAQLILQRAIEKNLSKIVRI